MAAQMRSALARQHACLAALLVTVLFASSAMAQTSAWYQGFATWYTDWDKGACGYETLSGGGFPSLNAVAVPKPKTDAMPLGFPLAGRTQGVCGYCLQVRCTQARSMWGKTDFCEYDGKTIIVQVTDECPVDQCANPNSGTRQSCSTCKGYHIDLIQPAFDRLASGTTGVIQVDFRRVPCKVPSSIWVKRQAASDWWQAFSVRAISGWGQLSKFELRPAGGGWKSLGLDRSWAFAPAWWVETGGPRTRCAPYCDIRVTDTWGRTAFCSKCITNDNQFTRYTGEGFQIAWDGPQVSGIVAPSFEVGPGGVASGGCVCTDMPPSPDHTCAEQKAWGKCGADWMKKPSEYNPVGFCQDTCGRCNCPALDGDGSSSSSAGRRLLGGSTGGGAYAAGSVIVLPDYGNATEAAAAEAAFEAEEGEVELRFE